MTTSLHIRGRVWLAGALALMLGLVWVIPASAAPPQNVPLSSTAVTVPANRDWVDTGISLSPNLSYSISATGVSYWYGGSAQLSGFAANASGIDPFSGLNYGIAAPYKCLVPPGSYCFGGLTWAGSGVWSGTGLQAFSLIGKIGSNGTPFFVGEGPIAVTGSGELYLTFNDTVPFYGDNYGGFDVTVNAVIADASACKNGAWKDYGIFKNQGDCVSFVATGGKNQPG